MRQREQEKLSPEQLRELEALDAALADRPVDTDLDEIAALARALRDERSATRPEFAAELDAKAGAGFPRRRSSRVARPFSRLVARLRAVPPRRLVIAAGSLGTLGIVVAVALSVIHGSSDKPRPSGVSETLSGVPASKSTPSSQPGASSSGGAVAQDESLLASPASGLRPGQDQRKVERSAELTLSSDRDQVSEVADDVIGVTDRYRGIVVSSEVSEDDVGARGGQANLELAIPALRLQAALRDLSALAHVDSRSEDTLDITAPFVSARGRVRNARTQLNGLLRQLGNADTQNEAESLRARIRIARERLAASRAALQSVARRADLSRVSVMVLGDGDGAWTPGDAVDDALDVLKVTLGVLLVAAAVLLPVGALALLAWLNVRLWRRRRRERALDA